MTETRLHEVHSTAAPAEFVADCLVVGADASAAAIGNQQLYEQPDTEASARPADPTLHTLLYRYVFFAWLFKDAGRGCQFQRAAAWRHNVEQARWLPTYMRRYCLTGLLLVSLGCATELSAPLLSVLFFLPGLVTVLMTTVAFVGWVRLRSS
jgi:hypothetical protein